MGQIGPAATPLRATAASGADASPGRGAGVARLRRRISPDRVVKSLGGSVLTWGFLRDDGSAASTLHHAFCRRSWNDATWRERTALCAGYLAGVPVALVATAALTARLGGEVARRSGKGRLRQAGEELALAYRRSIPPLWYYVFELWHDEHRAHALEYLYRFETKGSLYPFLRRWLSSTATTTALTDKGEFALHCGRHGVPVIPALAVARRGVVQRLDGGGAGLPRTDLFLKPVRGAGGRGAVRWRYRGDGTWQSHTGVVLDEPGLVRHLESLSLVEDHVVRRYVCNHADLADLSPGALCTVRMVSCVNERGEIEPTHAVLRMPRRADTVVDNFHAGGIAARVDLETGILGPATNLGTTRDTGWWESHPLTGGRILGRQVPCWAGVLDVVRRAHAAFPDQSVIGWDVAVLDEGPHLVEGNKSPDLDIIQRTHEGPAGNSRLGELLVFHLGRALERRRAARAPGGDDVPARADATGEGGS